MAGNTGFEPVSTVLERALNAYFIGVWYVIICFIFNLSNANYSIFDIFDMFGVILSDKKSEYTDITKKFRYGFIIVGLLLLKVVIFFM